MTICQILSTYTKNAQKVNFRKERMRKTGIVRRLSLKLDIHYATSNFMTLTQKKSMKISILSGDKNVCSSPLLPLISDIKSDVERLLGWADDFETMQNNLVFRDGQTF